MVWYQKFKADGNNNVDSGNNQEIKIENDTKNFNKR